jgi:Family of unknown function (DUF6178)
VSDDPTRVTSEVPAAYRGMTCKDLVQWIFNAPDPEVIVRQLPAQSLYMVIRQQGILSSSELLELLTIDQGRLVLDLDLWSHDEFKEEHFWEWLRLADESDSLEPLQRLLRWIDLKLLGLMIARYVHAIIPDEPADMPPAPGYHSPDNGRTWIGFRIEDADRHFIFARFLALIFETSFELFYQLLGVPGVATEAMLQEESYQERLKRLASDGVPEPELAAQVHAPIDLAEVQQRMSAARQPEAIESISTVEPLLYESRPAGLFARLVNETSDREGLQAEFTFLVNAAIIHHGVDFADQDEVLALAKKVKGALSLGLSPLLFEEGYSLEAIEKALGLGPVYRLGYARLQRLKRAAMAIGREKLGSIRDEPELFGVVACARESFPAMPVLLDDDGTVRSENGRVEQGARAIESEEAYRTVQARLREISG